MDTSNTVVGTEDGQSVYRSIVLQTSQGKHSTVYVTEDANGLPNHIAQIDAWKGNSSNVVRTFFDAQNRSVQIIKVDTGNIVTLDWNDATTQVTLKSYDKNGVYLGGALLTQNGNSATVQPLSSTSQATLIKKSLPTITSASLSSAKAGGQSLKAAGLAASVVTIINTLSTLSNAHPFTSVVASVAVGALVGTYLAGPGLGTGIGAAVGFGLSYSGTLNDLCNDVLKNLDKLISDTNASDEIPYLPPPPTPTATPTPAPTATPTATATPTPTATATATPTATATATPSPLLALAGTWQRTYDPGNDVTTETLVIDSIGHGTDSFVDSGGQRTYSAVFYSNGSGYITTTYKDPSCYPNSCVNVERKS